MNPGNTTTGPEAARMRVLVVEDNPAGAESLELLLRLNGHEPCVVADGESALRQAAEGEPDVVLLDLGLPGGMDGCEVARRLRRRAGARGKVPFLIAVTGHGAEDDRRQSAEAGIDLHLVKPLNFDLLQAVLRRFGRVVGPN
jgi:CheY-like chemotaxis protein